MNHRYLPLGSVFLFVLAITNLPTWSYGHGAAKAVAAPYTQSLGAREKGDLRLSAEVVQGEELEIEVRVEQHLSPPDPIAGEHVALAGAIVSIGVSRGGVMFLPPVPAHSEGDAGVYGAHFARQLPGDYIAFVEVERPDGKSVTEQFPFKLEGASSSGKMSSPAESEIMMTHPFLAHMGLPDAPGAASLRVSGIRRTGALGSGNDLAIHVEAGLWGPLGIHLRNDAITNDAAGTAKEKAEDHGTEVMLMYGFLMSEDRSRGLSVFAEISWPTVQGDGDPVRGGVGLAGTLGWSNRLLFDGNVHVVPNTKGVEVEYEGSFQVRVAERIFLLLENRGEFGSEHTQIYLLPAIKAGLGSSPATFGIGLQFPLTEARQYERQVMFQIDWEF